MSVSITRQGRAELLCFFNLCRSEFAIMSVKPWILKSYLIMIVIELQLWLLYYLKTIILLIVKIQCIAIMLLIYEMQKITTVLFLLDI